jgi:hypothetical protein
MARSQVEMASASGAMRAKTAPQHSKCHEFPRPARGGYWMAHGDYLFSVALKPDGRTIEWLGRDEQGQVVTTTDEPGNSTWLQLKLWLQSLLVDERLL